MADWLGRWLRPQDAPQFDTQEWPDWLAEDMALSRQLDPEERNRLLELTFHLVKYKEWEGCGGLALTERMQVLIAAHAALLILNIGYDSYPNVSSILVYPAAYIAKTQRWMPGGYIREQSTARSGESWENGPVIVSWQDVQRAGLGVTPGSNVALHEFAHKLDSAGPDPVAHLLDAGQFDAWVVTVSVEFALLQQRLDGGLPPLMNTYAATNPAEFFAVATEMFFETPHAMRLGIPRLYAAMSAYYRQDPALRTPQPQEDAV